MTGKFELYCDKAGEFRFRLKSSGGEIILASEGYRMKSSAMNGIESVKKNAGDQTRYERKRTRSGRTFFNLRASNGQVIGTSDSYDSPSDRDIGVEKVRKAVESAKIADLSKK